MGEMFRPRSKAPRILELWAEGKSLREIASEVGCTKANVVATVRRHRLWNNRVDNLPDEYHDWLIRKASMAQTPASVFARALLIDAINDAMESGQ